MTTEKMGAPAARTVLVIDRSKWLRGEADSSMLRRPSDGKMCCLGFEALACGYAAHQIDHMGDPEDTVRELHDPKSAWPPWLLAARDDDRARLRNTDACKALILTNDDPLLPESAREEKIAAIFAEHGIEVRFVDESSNG